MRHARELLPVTGELFLDGLQELPETCVSDLVGSLDEDIGSRQLASSTLSTERCSKSINISPLSNEVDRNSLRCHR